MSKDNDHEAFDRMRHAAAAPLATPDELVSAAVLESALYNPQSRQAVIDGVTSQINDQETSLRKRAQLLRLERELSQVHVKLLSVGR